jgi:hypothetical protein
VKNPSKRPISFTEAQRATKFRESPPAGYASSEFRKLIFVGTALRGVRVRCCRKVSFG